MIEVDEVTKSIMHSVQQEMYEGTRSALVELKDDLLSAVASVNKLQKVTESTVQLQVAAVQDQMSELRSELNVLQRKMSSSASGADEQIKQLHEAMEHTNKSMLDGIQRLGQQIEGCFVQLDERMNQLEARLERLEPPQTLPAKRGNR